MEDDVRRRERRRSGSRWVRGDGAARKWRDGEASERGSGPAWPSGPEMRH